ncbi:hypothetical protein [Zavarzinia sp. CC-PAN008]|uniref:hypothetical protein n=1 Tax=Zavarzinia sp. CC-PAN008 TaxID=3243332 RepID=UPI003F746124
MNRPRFWSVFEVLLDAGAPDPAALTGWVRRTVTIWRVVDQTEMIRHYHFETKGQALRVIKEMMKDRDPAFGPPELEAITVELNRTGIVDALNGFIDMTCVNDG